MTEIVSLRDYMDAKFQHVNEKFIATEKTVDGTAQALKEKLAEMNQFRTQLDRERSLYVTRDFLDALLKPLQSRQSFASGALWLVGALGTIIGLAIPVILYWLQRKGA